MNKIKVVIADDHTILRDGLAAMLAHFEDIEIVGSVDNGQEAIEKVKTMDPDVILLDLAMPAINGLDVTKIIVEQYPKTKVLVLSQYEEPQFVIPVIEAGADGFIPKRALGRDLIDAIRAVAKENSYYYPSVTNILAKHIRKGNKEVPPRAAEDVTSREKEIIWHVAMGRTNSQIASALSLSIKTVEWHRSNIMHKLGIHKVADLVRYALRMGIIREEELQTHPE